jgi:hypothetical protein
MEHYEFDNLSSDEVKECVVDWTTLPLVVMNGICTYLSPQECVYASRVCVAWWTKMEKLPKFLAMCEVEERREIARRMVAHPAYNNARRQHGGKVGGLFLCILAVIIMGASVLAVLTGFGQLAMGATGFAYMSQNFCNTGAQRMIV